jgi:quercetin dioxygenase-like cupin family protein
MAAPSLFTNPVHLGLGATAEAEPEFSGMSWYEDYTRRHASDGAEGRLVSLYQFTESWNQWEMHPRGAELVVCVGGSLTLHQEKADGTRATVELTAGQYAINEPGTWHTADVETEATALFITAGVGTQHRAR